MAAPSYDANASFSRALVYALRRMADERRSARRARIPRARVIYESATGDQIEAVAVNIGRGGLFIRTASPLAVGKRLSLEIQVRGELAPWSALGRVVWLREQEDGERRPAGMGVKLIDVEDSVCDAIERLVARYGEATEVGDGSAPSREQTAKGITPPQPAPVAPIVAVAPSRERTMLGVGLATPAPEFPRGHTERAPVPEVVAQTGVEAAAAALEFARAPMDLDASAPEASHDVPSEREHSIAIDLVGKREARPSDPPVHDEAPVYDDSPKFRAEAPIREQVVEASEPPAIERPRRGRWIFVALILAAAGVATCVLLDGDLDRFLRPPLPTAPPRPASPPSVQPVVPPTPPTAQQAPTAAPSASAAGVPTAPTSSTTAPTSSATTPASASASPSGSAARKAPQTPAASAGHAASPGAAPAAPKKPPSAADNPY